MRDIRARARIVTRIKNAEKGNFGDCEPVGDGISEMRRSTWVRGIACTLFNVKAWSIYFCAVATNLRKSEISHAPALEDSNPDVFLSALADVAKARGMAKIASDAGLSRESLYKALAPGAKPRYETVRKLMDAMGVKITAQSAHLIAKSC